MVRSLPFRTEINNIIPIAIKYFGDINYVTTIIPTLTEEQQEYYDINGIINRHNMFTGISEYIMGSDWNYEGKNRFDLDFQQMPDNYYSYDDDDDYYCNGDYD